MARCGYRNTTHAARPPSDPPPADRNARTQRNRLRSGDHSRLAGVDAEQPGLGKLSPFTSAPLCLATRRKHITNLKFGLSFQAIMSLYRQKKSLHWCVDISIGQRRVRQGTGTADRKQAQEFHDRLKNSLWEQQRLGVKPRYTWREVVVRYLREAEFENKASISTDKSAFRHLDSILGDRYLDEIDKAMIDHIITERQKSYEKVYKSGQRRVCQPGVDTINRFLTTLRAALNKACNDWDWVDRVPKVKALKGAKNRTRWITRAEANKLIAELPDHLAVMAEFSLQTGLRRRNVTHLRWACVDLARRTAWIPKEESKNRKAISVPLSDVAVELLKRQHASQAESPCEWGFPHRGKPVTQAGSNAWRLALQRAGITDFCWHDLRHTWASWHVQNGTPLQVLQELGGWSSITMVQRYAHLSGEHLRAWVNRTPLQLVATAEGLAGSDGECHIPAIPNKKAA